MLVRAHKAITLRILFISPPPSSPRALNRSSEEHVGQCYVEREDPTATNHQLLISAEISKRQW
jgi:hypothetical protein